MPLLSVITVTYNAMASISPTLESIAAQTCSDYECLIVDGASTDSTCLIVSEYIEKVPKLSVTSEPDDGLYDAMNKGLKEATGKYVLFLHAGDVLHDSRVFEDFANMIASLESLPVLVYGHTTVFMNNGKTFLRKVRPLNYIQHGQPTIYQSVFFRRDVHLRYPYQFDEYPISSDYAVMAEIQTAHSAEVYTWDRNVSDFHNDPESVSNRNLGQRLSDAWCVQRDILKVPIISRIYSAIRRIGAHAYYTVRQN